MANLDLAPSRFMLNLLHVVEPYTNEEKNVVNAIVEINSHSINKYELITETGHLKLDRVGYSSLSYPFTYGAIPMTWDQDGDPLDVVIINVTEPLIEGSLVESVSKFKSDTISEIDVTAPELVSINLDSLHQTIEGQIVISGEARGAAKIFVNNFEVNDRSGEKFSLRQSLKLGENFIDLVLVDEVGNSFTKRYVVNRINEPEPISFPN